MSSCFTLRRSRRGGIKFNSSSTVRGRSDLVEACSAFSCFVWLKTSSDPFANAETAVHSHTLLASCRKLRLLSQREKSYEREKRALMWLLLKYYMVEKIRQLQGQFLDQLWDSTRSYV